jgi:hypothetical protein
LSEIDFAIASKVGLGLLVSMLVMLVAESGWSVDVMLLGRFRIKGDGVKGCMMSVDDECLWLLLFDRLVVLFVREVTMVQPCVLWFLLFVWCGVFTSV